MKEEQLRELADEFLVPLFSGAWLEKTSVPSTKKQAIVALADPCTIAFKPDKLDTYRLLLRRSQEFERVRAGQFTECDVVEAFVKVVRGMSKGLRQWYHQDLKTTFPRRVVARSLCEDDDYEKAVLDAIDQFTEWAGRLYEGKPIVAAIGFLPVDVKAGVRFSDICKYDFSTVISNGFDTLLTCNEKGEVCEHRSLDAPANVPSFAPSRLAAIASWSENKRLALVLNRAGEILVFEGQKLRFARRGGKWHFLTHKPILSQMGQIGTREVRQAVYETALDASFARTGACIGLIKSGKLSDWKKVAVSKDDYLRNPISPKSKAIARMLNVSPFHKLDRRLRQELVAIDGATLIDYNGTVLAVGAILHIEGGSTGGGRLAAAKELSRLGLGIKVSQDGGILGFHKGNEEPTFRVM